MPAQRPGVGTLNQMCLSSPERPALAGSEDGLSRHGMAPNSNGLDEVVRAIEHTQRTGVSGEQLSGGLANDSVGFLGSDTGMEQINHLVNQGDLAGVLFQFVHPGRQPFVGFLQRVLSTPALSTQDFFC